VKRFVCIGGSLVCQDGGRVRHISLAEALETMERLNRNYERYASENDEPRAELCQRDAFELWQAEQECRNWRRAAEPTDNLAWRRAARATAAYEDELTKYLWADR
jgi:hypothetical protein